MSASVLWRWFRGSQFPGGEFRWFNNHAFRYPHQLRSYVTASASDSIRCYRISIRFDQKLSNQHQIRSDVIESGVHIQHLDQYLIDRNQLKNLRSFSIRVTWSATLHDWFWLQSHLRLNFLIFQNDVSARIDRISAQDGVQMAWTSPKISLARALRCTARLPSFSGSLIPSRTRSACVIALIIDHHFLCLGNLPWTLHIFPSSVHTFELSVFIIANQ